MEEVQSRRGYRLSLPPPPIPFILQLCKTNPLVNCILTTVHRIHHISLSLLTLFL